MTFLFRLILGIALGTPCFSQKSDLKELELLHIHVLTGYPHHFDLSGITKAEDDLWVVNDKPWGPNAYKINLDSGRFFITDSISLGKNKKPDIEAIDYCPELGIIYSDEVTNQVFSVASESKLIFDKAKVKTMGSWGNNKGLEGVAVDCNNMVLYLAKEREPRFIITYDLKSDEVVDVSLKDSESDISDLKFENGFLYILERNHNLIAKMDVNTRQVVARVSYKATCSHPEGKLYGESNYGMAEALLLTSEEIWIGLDNNGLPFTEHANKTYGLSGDHPIIIRFKRPVDF